MNRREVALGFHVLNASTTTVEIAQNVALVFLGSKILDLHDRLEQNRLGFLEAVFGSEDCRHLERHFVGIHFVERSVDNVDVDINDRVATDDAVENSLFEALLDSRDEIFRD